MICYVFLKIGWFECDVLYIGFALYCIHVYYAVSMYIMLYPYILCCIHIYYAVSIYIMLYPYSDSRFSWHLIDVLIFADFWQKIFNSSTFFMLFLIGKFSCQMWKREYTIKKAFQLALLSCLCGWKERTWCQSFLVAFFYSLILELLATRIIFQ